MQAFTEGGEKMVLQLFSLPCEDKTIQECKLGEITEIISFEFEKRFCGAGTFSLEIPSNCNCAEKVEINTLIYSREDDMCFIAKNINRTENTTTVTGYDLNVMLRDRLTMPAIDENGVMGEKDLIQGTTEACVKHFIDYNMINSLVPERNYPRFAIGEDKGRGLAADSYYCGKQSVEDVVCALCEGADLGYRVRLDVSPNSTSPETPLIIFDVAEQVDKSADQSDRNRVIFSAGMKNINKTERETGITSNKNALWCEAGGIHDGFVFESDNEAPASWNRREEYVSLSVADKDSEADLRLYGRREMTDKFALTDSLTVEAGNPLDLGVVYDVGDIITVYDSERKVQLDSVISAASVKRSGAEHTVKITLGESKPKLIDKYAKQSDLLKKNQRDYPAVNDGKHLISDDGKTLSLESTSLKLESPDGQMLQNVQFDNDNCGLNIVSVDRYGHFKDAVVISKDIIMAGGCEIRKGLLKTSPLYVDTYNADRSIDIIVGEINGTVYLECNGKRIYFNQD